MPVEVGDPLEKIPTRGGRLLIVRGRLLFHDLWARTQRVVYLYTYPYMRLKVIAQVRFGGAGLLQIISAITLKLSKRNIGGSGLIHGNYTYYTIHYRTLLA